MKSSQAFNCNTQLYQNLKIEFFKRESNYKGENIQSDLIELV